MSLDNEDSPPIIFLVVLECANYDIDTKHPKPISQDDTTQN